MSGELLPCPFCGDSAAVDGSADFYRCYCMTCDTLGPENDNREYAIAAWNRRAPDQSAELVSELVERGEGLLKAYRVLIDHIGDDEFDLAAEHPASWASMMEATLAKAKAGGA